MSDLHSHLDELTELDPALRQLFGRVNPEAFVGLPKPPYVALIGAVIGQIVRYTHAKKVRGNLYTLCGDTFSPGDIDNLSPEQWRAIGLDLTKVEIISNINRYLSDNGLSLQAGDPNIVQQVESLRQIKGVGEWTVATTLLTSFLDWDTFPSGDLFIRKKIQKLYGMSKMPTIAEVKKISHKWSPYRSVVAWYLWRWFD